MSYKLHVAVTIYEALVREPYMGPRMSLYYRSWCCEDAETA